MKRAVAIIGFMLLYAMAGAQPAGDAALADQFFRQGDYEKAAGLYKKLYASDGTKQYYTRLVSTLIHLRDFSGAEEVILDQVRKAPGDYQYQLDLGNLYNKSGRPEKAGEHFQAVLKNLPEESHLVSGIAYTLYNYGENRLAIEALRVARKRLNDPVAFSFELARLYYLDRQPSSMIHELLSLAEQKPEYLQNIKGQLQFYLRDESDFSLLTEMLEKRMNRNAESPVYPELLIWRLLQQENFGKALDLAFDMDRKSDQGSRILRIAGMASAGGDFETASRGYQHLVEKGPGSPWYQTARIQFLEARQNDLLSGNPDPGALKDLEKNYETVLQEMGRNNNTVPVMKQLALLRGRYLQKLPDAISLLEETIGLSTDARFRAECKLELGDLYILANDVWEATLLYGQVEKAFKDSPLGQEARFRNARLSYYIGEFEWAKGQLDVLKAATSQLMANDALNLSLLISENPGPDSSFAALRMFAKAELLAFRNLSEEALSTLDSIPVLFPSHALHDDILMARANIFTRQGSLEKAVAALERVAGEYRYDIWADDALFKLGILCETGLNAPEKAMSWYEKLLLDHPGSLYVTEARKRFRALRGDQPPAPVEDFINEPLRF